MNIFFATDLHGSDLCFKKFCAAASFYRCDALILGGDITGKLLVPIERNGRRASYELGGTRITLKVSELDGEIARISDIGYYPLVGDVGLAQELVDPQAYERALLAAALERARRWVQYAEDKLAGPGIPIVFAPGNDDDEAIDAAFANSSVFISGEKRVVRLDGVEVVSTGWSNPTPWRTARELPEEQLEASLRPVIASLADPSRSIFNFHVPPYDTTLDVCPQLDDEFRVVTTLGTPVQIHAGSTTVRHLIEEFQPLVGLHGHIHESRQIARLGRTTVINPGSEYSEGVLYGARVTINHGKLHHTLTAG
jgi:Icc-related predicted phosphoesterase